jgi:hypothetical protein
MSNLTAERLRELVHYRPETGRMTWRVPRGCVTTGTECGTINGHNYRQVRIEGKIYGAHRLAWLYMTGSWPPQTIDHQNHDPRDNRWCNLREASQSQNHGNMRTPIHNTSGFKGVTWSSKCVKWQAQIRYGGHSQFLGVFTTKEAAANAYWTAAQRMFREYAYSGGTCAVVASAPANDTVELRLVA